MSDNFVKKAGSIRSVIKYLQRFRNATVVIYLDDSIIDSPLFSSHIRDIALLHEAGLKVVIIPGARKRIDEILSSSKIECEYRDNIRVTREDAMPLIKMAAFDVSNVVMTKLAANNITAIIGNWVRSRAKGIINGYDFGTAGEIDRLQTDAINTVLQEGFIPIFPCIGWSGAGHPYNISSVELAQQVAVSLHADKLFFVLQEGGLKASECITNESVARNEDDIIAAMSIEEAEEFLEQNKGTTKKIPENSSLIQKQLSLLELGISACKNGVTRTHIVDGNTDGVLLCEIFSNLGSGTMIFSNSYGKIRQMQQNDLPQVLRIMKPFVENGKLLERTEATITTQIEDYIVYEIDGTVHACAALHSYPDGQTEIAAVAVEENFAHMGIGPEMIKNLIQKAKSRNSTSIFILTTQAADWFETQHFKPSEIDTLPPERKALWSPERNSKLYRLKI